MRSPVLSKITVGPALVAFLVGIAFAGGVLIGDRAARARLKDLVSVEDCTAATQIVVGRVLEEGCSVCPQQSGGTSQDIEFQGVLRPGDASLEFVIPFSDVNCVMRGQPFGQDPLKANGDPKLHWDTTHVWLAEDVTEDVEVYCTGTRNGEPLP